MGGAFPKTHLSRQPRPPGQERPEVDSGQQTPGPQAAGASPLRGGGTVRRGEQPREGSARGGGEREPLGEEPRGGGAARAPSSSAVTWVRYFVPASLCRVPLPLLSLLPHVSPEGLTRREPSSR